MIRSEITAAVLVIGDEILSGRTKDTNTNTIALALQDCGIQLKEARTIADDENAIIDAINSLRKAYKYVFTTGGIGPTHDDITAQCVAKAFGVSIDVRDDAVKMLKQRYKDDELTPVRLRMARIPDGAILIDNPVSFAPGFRIENVFVMAGVPNIMRAMLENIIPQLEKGKIIHSKSIKSEGLREGEIALPLAQIAEHFPDLSIGSYPWYRHDSFGTQLIVRGTNAELIETCIAEIFDILAPFKLNPIIE